MRRTILTGSAKSANLNGLDMCGKTGTSQNTKYGHQFDHSIFVGFAPMNAPKIAVAVFVENAG
jgi:penicillin-binding protein 2